MAKAEVILFKPSGKYYCTDYWEIPTKKEVIEKGGTPGDTMTPYVMRFSKDFRRIGGGVTGGPVLIPAQEPWGFPHLIP